MERDDLIMDEQYSKAAYHDEETGKALVKGINRVIILLSLITAIEVAVGIYMPKSAVSDTTWLVIKIFYLVLTIVKAGYIVMSFMHLGHERKNFKMIVLVPYIFFMLYLIFICLTEADSVLHYRNIFPNM